MTRGFSSFKYNGSYSKISFELINKMLGVCFHESLTPITQLFFEIKMLNRRRRSDTVHIIDN